MSFLSKPVGKYAQTFLNLFISAGALFLVIAACMILGGYEVQVDAVIRSKAFFAVATLFCSYCAALFISITTFRDTWGHVLMYTLVMWSVVYVPVFLVLY